MHETLTPADEIALHVAEVQAQEPARSVASRYDELYEDDFDAGRWE